MSLMAKAPGNDSNSSDFTPAPEGTHQAICNMVVDLGMQRGIYNGKETIKHKVYIRWELPTERSLRQKNGMTVDEPMTVGGIYTNSLHEKAKLRRHLEGWRGRTFTPSELTSDFDLFKLAGTACQVSVKHIMKDDRIRPRVEEVVAWPKGMARPKATEIGIMLYSPNKPEHLPDLPQWLRNIIDKQEKEAPREVAKEPAPSSGNSSGEDDLEDAIPF